VVAIGLGLLIGYYLRRWFQEKRPKMKVWSALKRARLAYDGELSVLKETDGERPYAKTTIDQRVYARETEIERLIETGEADKATAKVTALLGYIIRFVEYREQLRKLDIACTELEEIPRLDMLEFPIREANGRADAEALLWTGIDSPSLDSGEEELKGLLTKVNNQIDLIVATTRSVKASIRHLLTIPEVKKAIGTLHGDQPEKLRKIEVEIYTAAEKKLQAGTADQLEEAKADDDKAMRELANFARPERGERRGRKIEVNVPRGLLAPGEDTTSRGGPGSGLQLTYIAAEPAPQLAIMVDISGEVEGIKDGDDPRIHVGDIVRFDIDFKSGLPIPFPEIDVDFGDESPHRRLRLPKEGSNVFVRHRYKGKEVSNVKVMAIPGGQKWEMESPPEIVPKPRQLKSEAVLAESEKVVTVAAFLLAVASGMGALYFGNASWGQPMDYLAAIVWGGATGEGVKYAASIADRVWPLS
jgi:hypothetical protein